MSDPGQNLGSILAIWADVAARHSMAPLIEAMAEDVVWQGLLPELVCHGRSEVASMLGRGGVPRVTRMEAAEVANEKVVVTVESPDFGPSPVAPAVEASRTLLLSFEGDRIVRMESFPTRAEALARTERGDP